ncbi:MAG TPA: hypothetical protein VFF52_05240 [Isosphaeraceae bacterium]|nr:hypothetical protein [Isosphaeraceae bacterium]
MLIQTLCMVLAKRVGALLVGAVILWQVAEHSGTTKGQAIVHVSAPKVEVMVDDARYWVETLWETPIVCDLRPGRHTVRMSQSGRVVYEEAFTIAAGQEVILAAWDGYVDGRSPEHTEGLSSSAPPTPEQSGGWSVGSGRLVQVSVFPIIP